MNTAILDRKPETTDRITTNEERILSSDIMLGDDEGIFELRWQANNLIKKFMQMLSGYVYREHEGELYFEKSKDLPRFLSLKQTLLLIQSLVTGINQVTSLSYVTNDEANNLYCNYATAVNRLLVSKEFDSATVGIKQWIAAQLKNLMFMQGRRAIKGREARGAVTRIQEDRRAEDISQQVTTNSRKGFEWNNKKGMEGE